MRHPVGVNAGKIFCRQLDTTVSLTLIVVSYPTSSGALTTLYEGSFDVSAPASPGPDRSRRLVKKPPGIPENHRQ
ncbi:hypothetical protein AB1484_26090 [Parafrankia sp. FMc6]|uniref:hypothetical protein n=1 Tax=Parafrankia soli TaxID=2599596 RepID=UPI0034D45001